MKMEEKIINIFRKAGASTSFNAIFPSEHGIVKERIFNKLVRNGVLVPIHDGRYYLNEVREKVVRKRREDLLGIVLMVIAILVLIAVFWQWI